MRFGIMNIESTSDENVRLIARLDIKGANLIKGIHLEGLRVIGAPNVFALDYYREGIDEIIFMDSVASLYGRNHLADVIRTATESIFVPLTVGGGIRSIEDAKQILRAGADKVAINTHVVQEPKLISEVAEKFGNQCMVLSIEAKQVSSNDWEVYVNNGREKTGIDVVEWAVSAVELGAGEILLTSIDREGTRSGFDIKLVKAVTREVSVPVIASGGMGALTDFVEVVQFGGAGAVAMADILHYKRALVSQVRDTAKLNGLRVRSFDVA
jgi:cyclase